MSRENGHRGMHKRRITLVDGRYLIFYTFEDANTASTSAGVEASDTRPEPDLAEPEGERRV